MNRYLVILPLLSAFAAAQSDREVIVDDPTIRVELYAMDLFRSGNLTSGLEFVFHDTGHCIIPIAPPLYDEGATAMFVGTGETMLPLAPLGLDGWLLVDPVLASVANPSGVPLWIPFGSYLAGLDVYFQSASLWIDPGGGPEWEVSFSHGMRVTFGNEYPFSF